MLQRLFLTVALASITMQGADGFASSAGMKLSRSKAVTSGCSRKPALAQRSGLRAATAITDMVFEPQAPPMATIVSMVSIFGLAGYWWLVFVPSERRDLAANKNKGGLNGYLDVLAESPDGERGVEKWFYTEWLRRRENTKAFLMSRAEVLSQNSGESFDTVLARLEEEEADKNIERSKAMPAFMSTDNPLVVAAALVSFGVVVAAAGR